MDAFLDAEIDLPDYLIGWYREEARAKNLTLEGLLSSKTSGLTVHQLEAAQAAGKSVSDYVTQWVLSRNEHEIVQDWTPAPPEPKPPEPESVTAAAPRWRGPRIEWITGTHTVVFGCAFHWVRTKVWLDLAIAQRRMLRVVLAEKS